MGKKWKRKVREALEALLVDDKQRAKRILIRCLSGEKLKSVKEVRAPAPSPTFQSVRGGGHGYKR